MMLESARERLVRAQKSVPGGDPGVLRQEYASKQSNEKSVTASIAAGKKEITATETDADRQQRMLSEADRELTEIAGKLNLVDGYTHPFAAGRYHSLVIPRDGVPPGFHVTAWVSGEDTVMGVRHETHPTFGVQFHPESVLTGENAANVRARIACRNCAARSTLYASPTLRMSYTCIRCAVAPLPAAVE